ncbi:MAG: hypothetical protein ACFB5Z_15945 [Elainellaceae cyanobacterium]
MPTDLARQIAQFRSRCPFVSLTTALLMVHNDAYVVRAIAQAGPTVVATAMAAHPDLEKAEDRAMVRLLERLDLPPAAIASPNSARDDSTLEHSPKAASAASIQTSPFLPDPAPPVVATAPLAAPFNSNEVPGNVLADDVLADTALAAPLSDAEPEPPNPPAAESSSDRLPPPEALPPLDATIPGLDQPSPPKARAPKGQPKSAAGKSAKPAEDAPKQKPTPARLDRQQSGPDQATLTPKDLSDIIARTSVELRRLSWTDEQGRNHLQNTYGKRSRQQLTDPELVDFLRYLEQQPAPEGR